MSNLPNNFEQHRLNALKSLHEKARLSLKHQNQHNFNNTNHLYSLNYQSGNNAQVNTNYQNHGQYYGHNNNNQFASNSNYSQYNSNSHFNNTVVSSHQYPYQLNHSQVISLAPSTQANLSAFTQTNAVPGSTYRPSTGSGFDNNKNIPPSTYPSSQNIPSTSLAALAEQSLYTPLVSVSENDVSSITETSKSLPVKKKDAKTAINDILALGYNYYDLIALGGISPQFLDTIFPEIKFEIQQKHESLPSTKDKPQEPLKSVSPAAASVLRDSTKSPITPSILTPVPQISAVPSQGTSTPVPSSNKHINKKVKFGSNRWEKCLNITISDSEDSDDEFGSNMKRKLPLSRNTSQMNISEQIRLLKEKINKAEQVRIQTPPATDQPVNVSVTPSKSLSPGTLSSNSSDNLTKEIANLKKTPSINAPTSPSRVHTPAPNSDKDLRIIKSKLAEAHNILDQYQKDRESLLVEKTQCEVQLKSMNMEKHEQELTELKSLLDQKLKEHIARRIEVATVKANLEAVEIRMKAINDSIEETRKSISSLDLKTVSNVPVNVDSSIDSDGSDNNNRLTKKSNNNSVETNSKPVNMGSGHSFSVSKNTRMKSADFFDTEILTYEHQEPINSESSSSGDSPNSERRFNSDIEDLVENGKKFRNIPFVS